MDHFYPKSTICDLSKLRTGSVSWSWKKV